MYSQRMQTVLRRTAAQFLTDSCQIQRRTDAITDAGYVEPTWATVATENGRLLPETQRDQRGIVADRESNRVYLRLQLAYDSVITDGDRVVINGATYEVLQISVPTDKVFVSVQVARMS